MTAKGRGLDCQEFRSWGTRLPGTQVPVFEANAQMKSRRDGTITMSGLPVFAERCESIVPMELIKSLLPCPPGTCVPGKLAVAPNGALG
jgi:hypothetical protein